MGIISRIRSGTEKVTDSFKEGVGHILGHHAVKMVIPASGGAEAASNAAGGAATGLVGSVAGVATLGLTAAVSAGLVQMEFKDKCKHLAHLYHEEMEAVLGKKNVSANDLDTLAKDNHTIGEVLTKNRRERNLGVVLAVAASLVSLSIVAFAMSPSIGMFAAMQSAPLKFIAEALTGLVTYNAVRLPLRWIGNKIFGIERETTHDRIAAIHKDREMGKTITREQVFSAFVSANPELEGFVVSKYGKPFDKLDVPTKLQITENVGKLIHIGQLTDGINQGQINVTELAFAVEGQASGVAPKSGHAHAGLLSTIKGKLHNLVSHVRLHGHPMAAEQAVMEYANEPPKKSFVERLGLTRADTQLGHVEQLEQARSELTPNVTIH